MLISKIPENEEGKEEGTAVSEEDSDAHEYQTANELFELMAKNQNFDSSDVEKLTTRDLVLLYKNIDLGTKLMSNANELKRKKPNQYVETVVYNDEPESEGSDVSDVLSNEDLRNVFLANKERLDLLNTPPSVEKTLCHKLGDLQIQTSDLTTEYDKHYLLRDPFIKEQLKKIKLINKTSNVEDTVLPASLLDYICCKRLEDNYNFYMDNIIQHVKHTIDQLKRISNGDYLTEKAKEKWLEVETAAEDRLHVNTKVLATSTSIPLQVEQRFSGRNTTWDDLVHSAVDIRSLSKILEKKIVVEVPKLLCGPYKLLSKCCAENVIIHCKNEKRPVEERVDVLVQLKRAQTGQVISKISSIMILQAAPAEHGAIGTDVLPLSLSYKQQSNEKSSKEKIPKIIELEPKAIEDTVPEVSPVSECSEHSSNIPFDNSFLDNIDFESSDNEVPASIKDFNYQVSSESSEAIRELLDKTLQQAEVSTDLFSDDLRVTIRKLTMQSALQEESGEEMSQSTGKKKKSPTRVRIKSPYENQSHIMEEKKRRRLLEIRDKREKKKMALAENCKISKHKFAKGAPVPQSASSVTKLSISNKSFYNSIYGQTMKVDPNKQAKGRNQKGVKREVLEINLEDEGEKEMSVSTPDIDSKKYINRSYYLDDAVTEMMYMNMKRNENDSKDICSTSTSVVSNEFRNNLNYLSHLIGPSETDLNIDDDDIFPEKMKRLSSTRVDDITPKDLLTSQSKPNIVSSNSPNPDEQENTDPKDTSSVECRKDINKIYTLMNTFGKIEETENKITNSKVKEVRTGSMCQGSESGTSLKHRITSSNHSSFSFEKTNIEKPTKTYKHSGSLSPVIPKVIISAKAFGKTDLDKNRKKDRKKLSTSPASKGADNPLKALSQLLHEFDNMQKANRPKTTTEQKHTKKLDTLCAEGKNVARKSHKRRSRLDQHNDAQTERIVRLPTPNNKKSRYHKEMDIITKVPYQQSTLDDKNTEKLAKHKITDLLDEAKEARGEAVRGPSKLNSRLNSLAQPKKSYVQAHSEEYQTKKYGKSLMAHRLQKLAATPPFVSERMAGSARNKGKRSGSEAVPAGRAEARSPVHSPPPMARSPVPPPSARTRQSAQSSPERKERLMRRGDDVTGAPLKLIAVQPETPLVIKKKMVAVESYLKNHYGCGMPSSLTISDTQSPQKSRVPLLPNDIELASSTSSAQIHESTELGSKLHNIISSIMRSTSQGLEVLTECHESNSLVENASSAGRPSSDSDYVLDVLNDNNVITSIENITPEKEHKLTIFENTSAMQMDIQPVESAAELEKLENALCNHIPTGNFQKRLRINNLSMTPKQSMQPVFVLQSGDASSLIVKTPISQNMKEKHNEKFSDLAAFPVLSQSHLDWRFANVPMQISTIGYAFQDHNPVKRGSTSLVQLFDEGSKKSKEEKLLLTKHKSSKDNRFSQAARCKPRLNFEQAAQVDVLAPRTLVTVGISSTHTQLMESDKKQEIDEDHATVRKPETVITDYSKDKTVKDSLQQTQAHPFIGKKEKVSVQDKSDSIEYTTSLDILVGLLNEIQNITTCQTQITKGDKSPSINQQSKVLETILINEPSTPEPSTKSRPYDVVSFTSLDRLRKLESNQSLYSFYLSDNEGSVPSEIIPMYTNELCCPKRMYVDKKVGEDKLIAREAANNFTDVGLKAREAADKFTDVGLKAREAADKLTDVGLKARETVNNFTDVDLIVRETVNNFTDVDLIAKETVNNFTDVDLIARQGVNSYTDVPSRMLNVPVKSKNSNMASSFMHVFGQPSVQSMFSFRECPSVYSNAVSLDHKSLTNIPHILITRECKQSLDLYEVHNQKIESPNENKPCTMVIESFEKKKTKKRRKINNGKFRFKTDFDPIMKMKRDLLVTVYSILVFTVFAALSFPEMLYRI